jgi:hypothetical protein
MARTYIMLKMVVQVCTLMLMSACQQNPVTAEPSQQASLASIAAGADLVLNHDLVMPPNRARIYIQHGVTTDSSKIDRYQPWCEFEVKTLRESSAIIHADTFQIQKIVNERSGLLDGSALSAMGNPLEEFSTVLYLVSAQQPDVLRLTCVQRRGSRMQTYLKPEDIQSALGNIININSK